jgi:hypothetical protein
VIHDPSSRIPLTIRALFEAEKGFQVEFARPNDSNRRVTYL